MVAIAQRNSMPFDILSQSMASDGWDGLESLMVPEKHRAAFEPQEDVAKFIYGLSQTIEGSKVIEWLMDITLRQPLRSTGRTFEETALMTATRQGINGVGEAVLKAIARGEELVREQKTRNEP